MEDDEEEEGDDRLDVVGVDDTRRESPGADETVLPIS
jgi:hypothetical protein